MAIDLTGILSVNEYYTHHYLNTILEEDIKNIVKKFKEESDENKERTPWSKLKELSKKYYTLNEKMNREKGLYNRYKLQYEFIVNIYKSLGYDINDNVEYIELRNNVSIPVLKEVKKASGAPLLWILQSIEEYSEEQELLHNSFKSIQYSEEVEYPEEFKEIDFEQIITKYIFSLDEPPRFILLSSYKEIIIVDRSKWAEKRILNFKLDDILSRKEDSTLQAMTVLLHKDTMCPTDGISFLDTLSENSHKHASSVSEDLKYALRESIELLGNDAIRDMRERQRVGVFNKDLAPKLTIECLRYMYKILFLLYIEARPELGYAPMKSNEYLKGYSIESLRDVADRARLDSEDTKNGTYIDATLKQLFKLTYDGFPQVEKAIKEQGDLSNKGKNIVNKAFTMEPLKAHIFDPERTPLLNKVKFNNETLIKVIRLMSISKPKGKIRPGRISYAQLGINQLGAVYEALLSYRGFLAEEDLYEVKRAGDKVNELEVGYFVSEEQLGEYSEDERVRNDDNTLKKYPKGTFIYRLAGREREKSASYYTPEVLTQCLVKYSLKELLKDKTADEILELTICEPAMGSAAFLNEAVNQLAEKYLELKQKELGKTISHDEYALQKQKVKMYIADRNVYGVDLNPIAVELAEVSLWLNTIYKGAFVPWFGLQLVNGNSLVGARKQVYQKKLLLKYKKSSNYWYNEAPVRVNPGEKRPPNSIYHFLLGNSEMVNYNDEIIKKLEEDKIEYIKNWKKDFISEYNDDDIESLLRLSRVVDKLWMEQCELRKSLKKKTTDKLCVYGQVEEEDKRPLTTREKDKILNEDYKSKGMMNAGPYARLKFAMDYWCALWYWPIEKAELLPSRGEFIYELSLILEGGIVSVIKDNGLQTSLVFDEYDDIEPMKTDNIGETLIDNFGDRIDQVNLDMLCEEYQNHERLKIVRELAQEYKFMHWELEFADIFDEREGFDLILGNPPWIRNEWKINDILSEFNPLISIRKNYKYNIWDDLKEPLLRNAILEQYRTVISFQNYFSSISNFSLLKKQTGNIYKGFVVNSWNWMNSKGVNGLIHPEGLYDNPYGEELRKILYKKLIYHFEFINEKYLFNDVAHTKRFSINISSNSESDKFITITNLFTPTTIEECFNFKNSKEVMGLKDENNEWNIKGHYQRIINVDNSILKLFGKMFDGKASIGARMPELHAQSFINIYRALDKNRRKIKDLDGFYCNQFYNETKAKNENKIYENDKFPHSAREMVYLGPNLWVANPYFKGARKRCIEKSDYDNINLENIKLNTDYLPRTKYCSTEELRNEAPIFTNGVHYSDTYKILARRRLNLSMERSLISSIVPKQALHVHSVLGIYIANMKDLLTVAACMNSIIYDFYIKTYGKDDLYANTLGNLPIPDNANINMLWIRVLLLNGIGTEFNELWKEVWTDKFRNDFWAKNDKRLNQNMYKELTIDNSDNRFVANSFQRRQLMIEIDVLVSMFLNIELEDLKSVYRLQFSVLKQYEADTWYDKNGQIIFTTNRGLSGVGIERKEWNKIKDMKTGNISKVYIDDTMPGGPVERTIVYEAPFDRCDREKDYEEVWKNFEERFKDK